MSRRVELHVGDVGKEIVVSLVDGTSPVDLAALTSAVIKIQRPDQTVAELPASVLGSAADGKIVGVTTAETLKTEGIHAIQAYVVFGSRQWHSQSELHRVYDVAPNI